MAIGGIDATAGSSSALDASGLNMQDFMKILLTQLTYQDPLKPVDNQEFMAQMAQFTALQQVQDVNTKLDQLMSTQASLQSVGLIGKQVQVTTASGTVTGTVASLSFADATPALTITTASGSSLSGISLAQVAQVN